MCANMKVQLVAFFLVYSTSCTLTPTFASNHDRLYVDHQAENTQMDGSYDRPFNSIQEAINAATHGMTVIVRPGIYPEAIQFHGKQITVTGINPDRRNALDAYPVIDGNHSHTPVSFVHGEAVQTVLTGFVITRGNGAICCSASNPTITNCLIVGNLGLDCGTVDCFNSRAVISNCTIAHNQTWGLKCVESDVQLTNSILWNNEPNDLLITTGSHCSIKYCNLSSPLDSDPTNLSVPPLFANPGQWQEGDWISGDYHLSSRTGRWDPLARRWHQDLATSCGIDTGHSNTPILHEPAPNGGIINMGAYGGTTQASLSDPQSIYPNEAIPVYFKDPILKMAIEDELGVLDPTVSDMQGLTEFICTNTMNNGVKDLSGLQYALNLRYLVLSYNQIRDLTPLSVLINLTELSVNDNRITDLSPLSNLKQLTYLDVHRNELSDIYGLSGLVNLRSLIARLNKIDDINPLSGLVNLEILRLQSNEITDISSLSGLVRLTALSLNSNNITDASALTGLNRLSDLNLADNGLTSAYPLTWLTNLDVLDLSHNSFSDEQAHRRDLRRIVDNNPDIDLDNSHNESEAGYQPSFF